MKTFLLMLAEKTKNVVNGKAVCSSVMDKFVSKELGVFAGHYENPGSIKLEGETKYKYFYGLWV